MSDIVPPILTKVLLNNLYQKEFLNFKREWLNDHSRNPFLSTLPFLRRTIQQFLEFSCCFIYLLSFPLLLLSLFWIITTYFWLLFLWDRLLYFIVAATSLADGLNIDAQAMDHNQARVDQFEILIFEERYWFYVLPWWKWNSSWGLKMAFRVRPINNSVDNWKII